MKLFTINGVYVKQKPMLKNELEHGFVKHWLNWFKKPALGFQGQCKSLRDLIVEFRNNPMGKVRY